MLILLITVLPSIFLFIMLFRALNSIFMIEQHAEATSKNLEEIAKSLNIMNRSLKKMSRNQ